MSDIGPAVVVKNISKSFRIPIDKSSSIKQIIVNFYKRRKGYREFKVLNDISFEVKKGEFFGIVGRNGSGKSTLLKLLAGVYVPDKGGIGIGGSLTPFIELGVGFNPELTGKENIFLNGALLGFSKKEMEAMYDDIVDFAELYDFMEERLKNYSSGMQVRLAFSIAIRVNSDILVLDEVLAVGDEAFQQKCVNYFKSLKAEGKTVILVTHDMSYVERFCDRVIVLDKGKIVAEGGPKEAADIYKELNQPTEEQIKNLIRQQFLLGSGYELDFDNPKTFNEKVQWLKLNYKNPFLTKCADKYEVRDYVSKTIGDQYLVKLVGAWDKPSEIDFTKLPNKFVLKTNNGSGTNIICESKSKLDEKEALRKLTEWMRPESSHYYYSFEWAYKNIKPKIICEALINSPDKLKDYKFFCFNGKVKIISVCSERGRNLKIDFYDTKWKKLPFRRHFENSGKLTPKPKNFNLMVELAEKLAESLPFVRVDFYENKGKVIFGELTFYPGNGVAGFDPSEWDKKLGDLMKLPQKYP